MITKDKAKSLVHKLDYLRDKTNYSGFDRADGVVVINALIDEVCELRELLAKLMTYKDKE